jgi:hypothetical protein
MAQGREPAFYHLPEHGQQTQEIFKGIHARLTQRGKMRGV